MKQIWVTTILIWLLIVGILRLYPLSRGDKYFAKLQKWYWALENSQWEKAKTMEKAMKWSMTSLANLKNKFHRQAMYQQWYTTNLLMN